MLNEFQISIVLIHCDYQIFVCVVLQLIYKTTIITKAYEDRVRKTMDRKFTK